MAVLKRLSAIASQTSDAPSRLERRAEHDYFGWTALLFGIVALAFALLPGWIAPMYDPPSKPIEQKAADWLGELKDKAAAAIRMESLPPPSAEVDNPWRSPRIALTSLILGFGALVLGVLAFVRHEDQRMVACSIALGAGAISAHFILTAALILGFAVLVGVVLARHG